MQKLGILKCTRTIRNLDHKRIGDLSHDHRLLLIKLKDCVTRITTRPDGSLSITHERENSTT